MINADIRSTRLMAIAACVAIAGCATPKYVINSPGDGTRFDCSDPAGQQCNIPVEVQWKGVAIHPAPDLFLDQVAKPGVLAPSGNAVGGSLKAPVGTHSISVFGALSGRGGVQNYSASSSFIIDPALGEFSLRANPTDLVIERGESGSTNIAVTRRAPFAGAVSLSLLSPPTNVSASPVSVAAGAGSATFPISVAMAAVPGGKHSLTISGSAGTLSDTTMVKVQVGRTTGAFAEASPTPYTSPVPSSANSIAGGFRVDVALGGTSYPTGWRTATFSKGGQQIGQPVGFTIGTANNLAGAGFCANGSPTALTHGVVMSGAQSSYSSQNVITIVDLVGNKPPFSLPVDQTTYLNGRFYTFQPRVFFSPDCTLAMIASANPIGPQPHKIQLTDLQTGSPLGYEMPLNTDIFSAEVVTSAMGNMQEIVLRGDTGTSNAQVQRIPIR